MHSLALAHSRTHTHPHTHTHTRPHTFTHIHIHTHTRSHTHTIGDMECLPTVALVPFEPLVLWTDMEDTSESPHKIEVTPIFFFCGFCLDFLVFWSEIIINLSFSFSSSHFRDHLPSLSFPPSLLLTFTSSSFYSLILLAISFPSSYLTFLLLLPVSSRPVPFCLHRHLLSFTFTFTFTFFPSLSP